MNDDQLTKYTQSHFRRDLVKALPGYRWVVKRNPPDSFLIAIGTISMRGVAVSKIKALVELDCFQFRVELRDQYCEDALAISNAPTIEHALIKMHSMLALKASAYLDQVGFLQSARPKGTQ